MVRVDSDLPGLSSCTKLSSGMKWDDRRVGRQISPRVPSRFIHRSQTRLVPFTAQNQQWYAYNHLYVFAIIIRINVQVVLAASICTKGGKGNTTPSEI